MAHEATHSWIEYLIDPQNSNPQGEKVSNNDKIWGNEEIFAITTIRDTGRFGAAGVAMGQTMYDRQCERILCFSGYDEQTASNLSARYNIPLSAKWVLDMIFGHERYSK